MPRWTNRYRGSVAKRNTMFTNWKNYLPVLFVIVGNRNPIIAAAIAYLSGSGAMVGLAAFLAADAMKQGNLMTAVKDIPFMKQNAGKKRLAGLLEEGSGRDEYASPEALVTLEGGESTYQLAG